MKSTNHLRPGSESELKLVLEPDPELLDSSSDSEPELLLLALRREDLESTTNKLPRRLGEPGKTSFSFKNMYIQHYTNILTYSYIM